MNKKERDKIRGELKEIEDQRSFKINRNGFDECMSLPTEFVLGAPERLSQLLDALDEAEAQVRWEQQRGRNARACHAEALELLDKAFERLDKAEEVIRHYSEEEFCRAYGNEEARKYLEWK